MKEWVLVGIYILSLLFFGCFYYFWFIVIIVKCYFKIDYFEIAFNCAILELRSRKLTLKLSFN